MRRMDMPSARPAAHRVLVLLLCLTFALVGSVPGGARAQSATSSINVELMLDSSGSMEQRIGTETRMQIAKRVLKQVVAAIPEREGVNVGFRIYGHRGDNTTSGKAVSCRSSDLLVPIEGVDKAAIDARVDAARSTGWTPACLLAGPGSARLPGRRPGRRQRRGPADRWPRDLRR